MVIGVSLEPEDQPIVDNIFLAVPGTNFLSFAVIAFFPIYQAIVLNVLYDLQKGDASEGQ